MAQFSEKLLPLRFGVIVIQFKREHKMSPRGGNSSNNLVDGDKERLKFLSAKAAINSPGSFKKCRHRYQNREWRRKLVAQRLLRRLEEYVREYSDTLGLPVALVTIDSEAEIDQFKVVGSQCLEQSIIKLESVINDGVKTALLNGIEIEKPPTLPVPFYSGKPISLHMMNQMYLRALIPTIIGYSLRSKRPRYGKEETKPPWWPKGAPWANVRKDIRSQKQKIETSYTEYLKSIVLSCYRYHGLEHLLHLGHAFMEGEIITVTSNANEGTGRSESFAKMCPVSQNLTPGGSGILKSNYQAVVAAKPEEAPVARFYLNDKNELVQYERVAFLHKFEPWYISRSSVDFEVSRNPNHWNKPKQAVRKLYPSFGGPSEVVVLE